MVFKLENTLSVFNQFKTKKIAKLGRFLFVTAAVLSNQAPAHAAGPTSICDNIWSVNSDGNTGSLRYCNNYSLDASNSDIERAVIVIHGTNRNADVYYENILNAAINAEAEDNTMIIAPQFLTDDDLVKLGLPEDEYLSWSSGGWKSGSSNSDPFRYSTYSIVDDMIATLTNSDLFPNLREIVVAGHSAGGQFVNRYAASTQVEPEGVRVKYVVANPSSYLYLDGKRVVKGTLDKFEIPDAETIEACSRYNEWRYGLDDLFDYPARVGADGIRDQYKDRDVVYLLGSEDNDRNYSSLAKGCRAMLQGSQRLERGTIYFNYLEDFYGARTHRKVIVEGVEHSNGDMFNSPEGREELFGSKNTTKVPESSTTAGLLTVSFGTTQTFSS